MLAEGVFSWKKFDESMCRNIFYVEKELGACVTDEYYLSKLLEEIREINEHYKREAKESKRVESQGKRKTIG